MVASPDFGHLEPMVDAVTAELDAIGVSDMPRTVLADAGYWHQEQMQRVVSAESQLLIPPDSSRRKNSTRPGWDGGLNAFMRRVLATERGAELYARRRQLPIRCSPTPSSTAEWIGCEDAADPPFGPNGALSPPRTACSSSTSASFTIAASFNSTTRDDLGEKMRVITLSPAIPTELSEDLERNQHSDPRRISR